MLSSQRKKRILEILAQDKQVLSTELSQRFTISEDSIRRDLRELAAEGLLQRVHGGALPVSAANAPFETRKSVQIDSKRIIAQKAVGLIQPGQVVIIDGGTTTGEMIKLIPADLAFTVVTHSPSIAVGLIDYPQVDVIIIGGQLFKHSVVTVGASMLEGIKRINADLFFMGVTGVHKSAGFTTGNYEEACVKRALTERAAETVVMASQEKLNSASPFGIGELTLASTLLIENELDSEMSKLMKSLQITVI
ncbi:DeoR/GlpR family DNA-binding transcription regulator [Erwinia sp.]|uniref:DeoR/GlpR family DNA-binding transcription regulator n=1 Tax=Erwinia citreus TaxID=558 RepID=UPI003C7600DD